MKGGERGKDEGEAIFFLGSILTFLLASEMVKKTNSGSLSHRNASPKKSVRGIQRSEFSILRLNPEQFAKLQESKKVHILNVDKTESAEADHMVDDPNAAKKRAIYSVLVSARMDHDSPPRNTINLFRQFQKNSTKLKRSTSAELLFKPLLYVDFLFIFLLDF